MYQKAVLHIKNKILSVFKSIRINEIIMLITGFLLGGANAFDGIAVFGVACTISYMKKGFKSFCCALPVLGYIVSYQSVFKLKYIISCVLLCVLREILHKTDKDKLYNIFAFLVYPLCACMEFLVTGFILYDFFVLVIESVIIYYFTLFYDRFLNRKTYDENYWKNQINTPKLNAWSGISFEKVCLEHIPQLKKALGISGVQTDINTWHCQADPERGIYGSQIDLLIVRKDQIINVCEMKYADTEYLVDAAFDREQKRKMSDFRNKTKTKYALHSTLVTTYGVANNAYAGELQAVITSDDLFQ